MRAILYAFLAAALFADAQGVVDVHSHILPNAYVENLASHGAVMDEGFPLPKWNAEAQLKWMDEAGVETAVLTLAAPQVLTAGLEKMKKYLSDDPDLAPYRDMFLRENARALFNQQIKTSTKGKIQ